VYITYIHLCNIYLSFRVQRERKSLEYHLKKKWVWVLRIYSHSLQQPATVCNSLQQNVTRFRTIPWLMASSIWLSHTVTHSNTLAHTLYHTAPRCNTLQHSLQHTITHCSTLLYTVATHGICNLTARRCNTLQLSGYTATACDTLQHTAMGGWIFATHVWARKRKRESEREIERFMVFGGGGFSPGTGLKE